MGKSKKRRHSSHSSSSDSYEWKAAKNPSNPSKSEDDGVFAAVLNCISSSKSGIKEVFALSQNKASLTRLNPNWEKINASNQIENTCLPKQTVSTSVKDQGIELTQLYPNCSASGGEEHGGLVLEGKPAGVAAGCAKVVEERYVTISDINAMAARLLKAELSGNKEKMDKIKSKLEQLREAQRRNVKVRLTRSLPVLSKEAENCSNFTHLATAGRGGRRSPPYTKKSEGSLFGENYRRGNCHGGKGRQNRYLWDSGDSCALKMIRQEKLETGNSCDRQFASLASWCKDGVDDEYGNTFVNENAKLQDALRPHPRNDAIADYKRREYAASACPSCMDHTPRYLVVSVGHSMFLSLPEHTSLSRGHCFLTPLEHVGAMTRVDKAAVEEVCTFKRDLCRMATLWKGKGASYVFMEVAGYSNSFKHHVQIECVPVGREAMAELPFYFKKAMLDLGSEWDQNKRILSLGQRGSGAYKAIPPNFGYFCVEFGIDGGGYAKVIEDWSAFPIYFGREVLAGVLGKSADKWRKPKKDPVEQLRRKAVEFEAKWMTVEKSTKIAPTAITTAGYDLKPEGPELPP